jgi:hypothetical protein
MLGKCSASIIIRGLPQAISVELKKLSNEKRSEAKLCSRSEIVSWVRKKLNRVAMKE